MNETLPFDITKYYKSGVVVDTNLMILYVIGVFDINLIERHVRTKGYTLTDFLTLSRLLENFSRILTTANILTETSNLMEHGDQVFKDNFFSKFASIISTLDETYSPSKILSIDKAFNKFGLADSSISNLASEDKLIITDDLKLSTYLSSLNRPVINFNHIRTYYLLE